jgi:cob(I)alamin adenosyltransferase
MKMDIELHHRMQRGRSGQGKLAHEQSKGLLVVFTGMGKGKSTAAFGMGMRALTQNMKVGVVQFVGGATNSAEYQYLASNPLCDFRIFCGDCTWESRERNADMVTVTAAWDEAKKMLENPIYQMVILDDVNLLLKHQYISLDSLMQALRHRRPGLHVVITGRYAPFELIDSADLVTEMRAIKHPLGSNRIAPQAGVEY